MKDKEKTKEIDQEFFRSSIVSKYNTCKFLEKEMDKTRTEVHNRQEKMYKEKDKLEDDDLIYKEQFVDINFKLTSIVNDLNLKKTELFYLWKYGKELRLDLNIPEKIEQFLLDIENEIYKPTYAVVEDKLELIEPQRKKQFSDSFTNEEVLKEMSDLMMKYMESRE